MRLGISRRRASAALAAFSLAACTAWHTAAVASKADDTLIYASDSEPENVGPYHNNSREGVILTDLVWDNLLYRDPKTNALKPELATDWKWESPTALVVNLRHDVKFQNGDSFNADDVVFTFNYVVSPDSKIVTRQNVEWMKSTEKLSEYSVRINLKSPFPAALQYLAGPTPIYPGAYFKKVGLDGFAKAPIGTGPYKITAIKPGEGVSMVRNENYFKDSPRPRPKIGKLEFMLIPDPETRAAQLMTGAVDWIWRVPADQADSLRSVPNITVQSGETMRVAFLTMDAVGTSAPNSPFKDLRVRQAVNYAVNRKGMADDLVRGGSQPVFAPCYRLQFGCETQNVVKYAYDPDKARALLAQAGYAKGFDTDIYASRDRDYVEALIGDLRKVGIHARLHFGPISMLSTAMRSGHAPLTYQTWGSTSVNDASAFVGVYFEGGTDDLAQDQAVHKLLQIADHAVDPDARKKNYALALQRISEQAYWAPLFTYSTNYAYSSDLNFQAYADELPRFEEASWK